MASITKSFKSPFLIFIKLFVITRYDVSRMTEMNSRMNTIVIGGKFLFAILNQMKEKAQNIIEKTKAIYVLTLVFNTLTIIL